jgi:SNF2 family DNA or RNA helicase
LSKGMAIPNSAIPQVLALTTKPDSAVKLSMDAGAKAQAADATLHILLEPHLTGLSALLRVRPFGVDAGPYFAPAEGDRRALGVIDGEMRHADRDFHRESENCKALLAQSPSLIAALDAGGTVPDPEAALDLLAALQRAEPAPVLAWPKGKARRVISAGKFSVSSKTGRDWLGIEGELEHSEGTIKLSQLIGLLESSRGRYLTLDGERFIELSESLRKRVQSLANFADARGKVEVPLLAGAVLAPQLGLEHLDGLKLVNKKMAQAFALEAALPSTLQAELRDYQIAGFRWLMQMAHWGAGACLADDMGLGKTIQALALLLARASGGPAVVMAPTSVIGNWQREAARFAPTLNVLRFDALDRSAELPKLVAFDVLLVSYGLLTTHSESLSKPIFHTIVLDEAQAIKNATTQRAQAACALQGEFRLATTGTPLENHLGELWSLMRFLNPGLLSSQEKFQSRFSGPIERDPSCPAKSILRQLIAPFLLRRTKAQVLSELPPKTEITLTIAPSAEEVQLMQGLRAAALDKLGNMDAVTAEKRFHILAEITRLRRAACHPDLIAPELKIPSAKMAQLLELVTELKENRHRALIFSQFVDYLAIVRNAFDAAGISFQYLDGSTPMKAREAAVHAFQDGASDVFLLSLKAGGVGLNLTAADYVIHLDPWWNPAVEQQASDRAHRIGQTRPVTIYRLVLQGSIEEQILSLHGQKRELIDSMLSERESAKPVSADELMALISGG